MTQKPIISTLLAAGGLALCGPALAQAPSQCVANQDVGNVVISDQVPCDYDDNATISPAGLANFAWNTFIAVNWPAQDPYSAPYDRGVPDPNSKIGMPGQPGQDTPIVVWDSWREKRELFVIRDTGNNLFQYVPPEPFNNGAQPVTTGPNPQISACSNAPPLPPGHITALQTNKVENYVDETDEIGLAILWAGTDTQHLNEETLIRYQVKFNYDHYEDIRTKNWWDPTTLDAAVSAQQNGGNGAGVVLSSGSNSGAMAGSILTKSAWKMLSAAEVQSGAYYMQSSLFYEDENVNGTSTVCYNYGTFGLIGLHIIRKTDKFPYLFFSSFEHADNYPGKFTYANTNATGGPASNPYAASQVNPFGIVYQNPANPAPVTGNLTTPGYPATRLIQKLPEVTTANAAAASALAGTVWANYQLVGFQYQPTNPPADYATGGYYQQGGPSGSNGNDGYFPHYFADQDYYLANAVIETSQRFQFFTGAFSVSTVDNLALYPGNNPNATGATGGAVMNGKATKPAYNVNMGGCMGCHGQGQATGFSFTLGGAVKEPSSFSAETLSEKCTGELFASFDDGTGICTLN